LISLYWIRLLPERRQAFKEYRTANEELELQLFGIEGRHYLPSRAVYVIARFLFDTGSKQLCEISGQA
jgi:hypothetical protein